MQEYKNTSSAIGVLLAIFVILLTIDWLATNSIFNPFANEYLAYISKIFVLVHREITPFRALYTVLLMGICWLLPSIKFSRNMTASQKRFFWSGMLLITPLFIYGYFDWKLYNLLIYPVVAILHIYFTAKALSTLKSNLKEEDILSKVNEGPTTDTSIHFKTPKGNLTITNQFQGIWIEGGAGSGKSASLIEPIIHQNIHNGFAGVVYDFKGNPETLGLTAYNALLTSPHKVQFGNLTFTNLSRSIVCNPLDPKYLPTKNHVYNAAELILKNLNKEWVEKTDFWYDNAFAGLVGIIWMLKTHHPHFCDLPHVVSLTLQEPDYLLRYLLTDTEVKELIMPLAFADKKNAEGQIAGAMASLQLPMLRLKTEELFWVLRENQFSLDVSDPGHPTILNVCNDPPIADSLSPAIALVISVCMANMNQQGKNPSMLCIDEVPTQFIKGLDQFPATARSNKCATILGIQDFSQLIRDYGKKDADTIVANMGNQFTGMTNNIDTAKRINAMLGKVKKKSHSYSTSTTSLSESESLKDEEVMQNRDIAGQAIGHFTGKIAGGDPPFFSVQLPYFDKDKIYPNYQKSLPEFALQQYPSKNGSSPHISAEDFQALVKQNYTRINADIAELMAPHIAALSKDSN